jgi:hypothetical protein
VRGIKLRISLVVPCLRAVDLIPTRICRELTEIQKRIVYWTIKFVDAEAECYCSGTVDPQ